MHPVFADTIRKRVGNQLVT